MHLRQLQLHSETFSLSKKKKKVMALVYDRDPIKKERH